MEVPGTAAAPAAEGSVKWQLCYDVSAKTWWMVSGGGQVGESGSGLGCLILEGGGQQRVEAGLWAKDAGVMPQPWLGPRGRKVRAQSARRCSFGRVVSLHRGFGFLFLPADLGLAPGPSQAWGHAVLSSPQLTPGTLLPSMFF